MWRLPGSEDDNAVEDEDDDREVMRFSAGSAHTRHREPPKYPVPHLRYWRVQTGVTPVEDDEQVKDLLKEAEQERRRSLSWFLSDIELRLRLFFSAHFCYHNYEMYGFPP